MCDTKKSWFSRATPILVAFILAIVALFGFIVLKQLMENGLRAVATGIIPDYDNSLYHDIAASAAMVIVVLVFRCWGRVGLNWPKSRKGYGALAIFVCYIATINLADGFSFAHLTFHLVFFELLTEGLTGFWEELCFRGFLMKILQPCGILGSLLISSALFGILHVGSANAQFGRFLLLATFGLMMAVNRLQTNSILPAIVAHGTSNAFNGIFSVPSSVPDGGESVNQKWIMVGVSVPVPIYRFLTIRKNLTAWSDRRCETNIRTGT